MDPDAKLPDEIEIKPATPESIAAAEAARAEAAAATEEPAVGAGPGPDVVPPPLEMEEPPIDLPAEEKPLETVKTSKVAGKRLKKVLKKVQELEGEADAGSDLTGEKK